MSCLAGGNLTWVWRSSLAPGALCSCSNISTSGIRLWKHLLKLYKDILLVCTRYKQGNSYRFKCLSRRSYCITFNSFVFVGNGQLSRLEERCHPGFFPTVLSSLNLPPAQPDEDIFQPPDRSPPPGHSSPSSPPPGCPSPASDSPERPRDKRAGGILVISFNLTRHLSILLPRRWTSSWPPRSCLDRPTQCP